MKKWKKILAYAAFLTSLTSDNAIANNTNAVNETKSNNATSIENVQTYHNRSEYYDVLFLALRHSDNADMFFKRLKNDFKDYSTEVKRKMMYDIYLSVYANYDKNVYSGHSKEYDINKVFINFKRQFFNQTTEKYGNCGDFALFTYRLGKESFGWKGTIVSNGFHLFPIFMDDKGNFHSPENLNLVDNNFYTFLKKIRSNNEAGLGLIGNSHFFFDDKEFMGYVQDFLQRSVEKKTMPFGVTHLLDLEKAKIPINDSGIFVVGDDQLRLLGLKKSYKSNYDFTILNGEFGLSGNFLFGEDSTIKGQINSNTPYINLSFFNDVNNEFLHSSLMDNAKLTLGNFTKLAINWTFDQTGYGDFSYFFPAEVKAESSLYALASYNNNLYLLSSVGMVPSIIKPSDQTIKPFMKYELGLMYVGDGFNMTLLHEKVAKMGKTSLEINKEIGKTPFSIKYEAINTKFKNDDLKKMIPELQQRLGIAFNSQKGSNFNFGVTREGNDLRVSFDAKVPFAVLKNIWGN